MDTPPPNPFSQYRLVLVDDSDFARTALRTLLTQEGFNVVGEASNAGDALRIIKEKKPHLVLADVVMPETSGIELAENINQNFNNIGVIMVSSLNHEQIVLDAIAAGAVDFIAKPLNELQLIESVAKYLSGVAKD